MRPRLRKFVFTVHVASSVGWLGAAIAYLGLVVAALASENAPLLRAAYLAMEPITWLAIVPLAFASLVTGLVQGLGTQWGLFRYYWVVFKLLLSVLATAVLLLNTQTVSSLAALAADADQLDTGGLHGQLLHSGGGVLVLLVTTTLAIYKPRGTTPYGLRKQRPAAVRPAGSRSPRE
jgi:hypothetical protein